MRKLAGLSLFCQVLPFLSLAIADSHGSGSGQEWHNSSSGN